VNSPPNQTMTLRWNEPFAVDLTAAVQRGQADQLKGMLDTVPGLARVRIVKDGEAAGTRTLLHLFADWPGHRRNPREIVGVLRDAGADLDAWSDPDAVSETPLHWAASNDDVELVAALLDAGADIDAPGCIVNGLGPVADAAIFGGYRAGRLLVERGATVNIYQAAALGYIDRVRSELAGDPRPDAERITSAFWAACGGGNRAIAELLLANGADINWIGWGDQTPLDQARHAGGEDLALWLEARGASSVDEVKRR